MLTPVSLVEGCFTVLTMASSYQAVVLYSSPGDSCKCIIRAGSTTPTHPFQFLRWNRSQLSGGEFRIASSVSCSKYSRRGNGITSMVLPTANNSGSLSSSAKPARWSARAIKSFGMGELEARKLKYPTTGTEALLMGMLTEGTSPAARFLRANGITLFGVRDATVELLGKADMYYFSAEHPPLTEPAQMALDWAVEEHLRAGREGEVLTEHLLVGIWNQKGSAGQQILEKLGFDDSKAAEVKSLVRWEEGWGRDKPEAHSDTPCEPLLCRLGTNN